jgi:hypothetical protein
MSVRLFAYIFVSILGGALIEFNLKKKKKYLIFIHITLVNFFLKKIIISRLFDISFSSQLAKLIHEIVRELTV